MLFSIERLVRPEVDTLLDCSLAASNDDSVNKRA